MRTDGMVMVFNHSSEVVLLPVRPYAICPIGQFASIDENDRAYPIALEDVSLTADNVVGYFAENSCNPAGITLVWNEKPASPRNNHCEHADT